MHQANEFLWKKTTCPVCGAGAPRFITHDWQTINGCQFEFNLVQCGRCGTAYINPQLDREKVLGTAGGGAWHAAEQVNQGIYQKGLRKIQSYFPNKTTKELKLLDIGCGFGAFLSFANQAGFDVTGVEIDKKIAQAARENGFVVYDDFLENLALPDNSFDVITLWDVIEHVPDPVSLLTECHRLLRPGGVLFYHTGNAAFQVTKGRILAKLRPNEGPNNVPIQHILHLDNATSRYLLNRAGEFDYIEVRFLDTLYYPNKKKFVAMKAYNEAMRLLHRLGAPLWTSSLAAFARKANHAS
jgi:SAM-dependent methyltransferase